ncbi:SusC/RagA family TonB-linked outer membrane protein [Rhodocytophaga rosea]|uniref:SusC/RagA family TonB-linked outer membrane protein n=1 Tax=Rhodocytophaga rosea TaxID=2704465 RepID=A0A6C0GHS1_9BACT|nr:SusC/RagA family TonB-linked outer membrane protein [Rhodocytophaga rosea]QHT67548.1 SusC/RagA family TonB-linked outer membrane protein [Rhodocytophaga rosea]
MNVKNYQKKSLLRYLGSLFIAVLLTSTVWAGQADLTVTGRVTSEDGSEALPGVNVLLKGTNSGTITGINGEYSIVVPDREAVLIFSYVGYNSTEEVVNGRTVINVSLSPSVGNLNEVVVTALGIQREQKSLGYSVGKVEGASITKVAQENVLNGMAAKIPGVTINQTSGVGSSISVVIRGAKSLSSDNQPLFVIDGVPVANGLNNFRVMGDRNEVDYGNAITDLNPDDIESVSVLKGPSAAALYGSRAGNGVILITMKKGKRGQPLGITFSTSNVFEKPVEYLDFHYNYANGERNNTFDEGSAYWAGPQLNAGNMEPQWNSPLDANGNKIPTELRSYKDNMKNFLQTGITSTNNIALTGSTEKATFRLSLNNMINKGLIPNSDLYRNAISTATTYDITKNIRLNANLNFARSNSNSRPSTGNRGANPVEAVYFWPQVNVNDLKDYWVPGGEQIQQRTPHPSFDNPYFLAHALTNGFVRDRVYGNLKLDWNFTPELSAFARVSHDFYIENRETKIPQSYSRVRGGGYHLQDVSRNETNADFLLTYKKTISSIDLSVSGGGNYMKQNYRDMYTGSLNSNQVLIVPGLYRLSNIPADKLTTGNFTNEKAIYSLYGMTSIGFKDMLYLDLTARNDWSSTLPPANRSYFYPSASLSWLANYTFGLPQAISLLKFRAGWAQVGNDTQPYQLQNTLQTGAWGNLITTGVPASLLNAQLKPEIATSQEIGMDLNLFNNRVRFEGTYYYMTNKNQILSISSPSSSGYTSRMVNAGLLASRGWELSLGGTPIRNSNGWNLELNVNFTRNRTTVEELADGLEFVTLWDDNGGGSFTRVGEEIGNLYSRGYATVKDPNSPYYRWPILDQNGEWIAVNDRDAREKVGNFNPDFLMGMQATLSYKRFTLSASFDWRAGGEFQSYTYRYGESDWKSQRQIDNLIAGGLYSEQELIALLKSDPDKYIIPQNGNFPRVGGYTQETGGFQVDDGYDGAFIPGVVEVADGVYEEHLGGANTNIYPISNMYPWSFNKQITFDASFIKLREISLSYDIPRFLGLRNANISVFSRNIMLWTAAKIGIDPERAFQVTGGAQGNTVNGFRQGIELQNVMPWTIPFGFKLNLSF